MVVSNPKSSTIKVKKCHLNFCGGFQAYLILLTTFGGSFSQ
jgi:hypothetical protein